MKEPEIQEEREEPRRELLLILLIVPLGILCMFITGQTAIRLDPSWTAHADMGSNLDPNADFAVRTNPELIEPVNSNILTQPVWEDLFLTPNAIIPTRIIQTPTPTPQTPPTAQPTLIVPTDIPTLIPPPTTVVLPPPTTRPPPPPPPPPPPLPSADLSITVTNNADLSFAGNTTTYTITVINNGPSDVVGATVTDNIPLQVSSWDWTCVENNGANGCVPLNGSTTDFTNVVNLPAGSSIVYTAVASIPNTAIGTLNNTTIVAVPAGFVDPTGANDSATDTDTLITTPGDLGIELTDPPGDLANYYTLTAGSIVTFDFPTVVNGDVGTWDLIYYEFRSGPVDPGILLDWVIIEIGDGTNWYTVFNWGDEIPDANTNMDYTIPLPNPPVPPATEEEYDQRIITAPFMYNGTGVAIDLDLAGIPQATYPYLRITAPSGDTDGQLEIDGLVAFP